MTVDEAIHRLQEAMINGRYDAEALQVVAGYVERVKGVEQDFLAEATSNSTTCQVVRGFCRQLAAAREGRDE